MPHLTRDSRAARAIPETERIARKIRQLRWFDSCRYVDSVECLIVHIDEPTRRVVRIAGRLNFAQVPDLIRVCGDRAGRQLTLDLAELVHADAIGVEALRRLRREGATLDKLSEYMRLKLER